MVEHTNALMAQRVEDEKEKRHSEIRALQAQINPHFLYNTLDAIIWMAASGKNDEVMEMTSALARLFRTRHLQRSPSGAAIDGKGKHSQLSDHPKNAVRG